MFFEVIQVIKDESLKFSKFLRFRWIFLYGHILNKHKNNQDKIFDLLEEITRDLKNYELEFRIEELESKFAKDLSEITFNEIRELKKKQNIN